MAVYKISSSGDTYSIKSDYYYKPDKMGGTWGHDNNETGGGEWELDKIN